MTLWLAPPAGKVALCRKTEYEQLFKRPFKLRGSHGPTGRIHALRHYQGRYRSDITKKL